MNRKLVRYGPDVFDIPTWVQHGDVGADEGGGCFVKCDGRAHNYFIYFFRKKFFGGGGIVQIRARCIESSFHATGVYGITLRGEHMPPMYPQHQLIETGRATKSTLSVCVGLPNDLVDLSPFDFHFRMDRITKRCMPVEYLLMTGNARKDLKVRFVMGEGGGAQPECYDSFGSISFISQSIVS